MTEENGDLRKDLARTLEKIEELLDALPSKKAKQAREKLSQVRELLLDQRSPRFALVGRRGSGKSSLINALFGEALADVGHEKAQTGAPQWFRYESERGAMELLDTRGFQEAHAPAEADDAATPLDSILDQLELKCPDAVLFLVKAGDAGAAMDEDLTQLDKLCKRLKTAHGAKVPVVAVLTQCDLVEPKGVRLDKPDDERAEDLEEKSSRVRRLERQVGDQIREVKGLKDAFVTAIGVSAYQSWRSDGTRRADERWHVDKLVEFLYAELPREARLELVRLAQVRSLQRNMARTLGGAVGGACALIAATPIPVGDIAPITSLQVSLVAAIGYIGGRPFSTKTAVEFLTAMGGNVGFGFALREAARAVVKLIPVAGNLVSAAVAFAGTLAIGEAAIAYFIDGVSIDKARERMRRARQEAEDKAEKEARDEARDEAQEKDASTRLEAASDD
jgi:predicted GTPase/uncharacterized protein (DUF697 family)